MVYSAKAPTLQNNRSRMMGKVDYHCRFDCFGTSVRHTPKAMPLPTLARWKIVSLFICQNFPRFSCICQDFLRTLQTNNTCFG